LRYVACDLGAESGRVMVGTLTGRGLDLEEIHRFRNEPVWVGSHLYWDVLRLYHEMKKGLRLAATHYGRDLESLAVDTWGVDFGLVDSSGQLLANPVHYRDRRTDGLMEEAVARAGREYVFRRTGIQFLPFNTLYQLLAVQRDQPGLLAAAEGLLLLPDLFKFFFSGVRESEFTMATTTQFFDPLAGVWAADLLDLFELPARLLPPVVRPGHIAGRLLPSVARETGATELAVVAVGSHDTASAVAAVPAADDDYLYISSGTWSLVGTPVPAPVLTPAVLDGEFTNEGGVGGFCLHKNVAGLWLIQQCRSLWSRRGEDLDYATLGGMAARAASLVSFVRPGHPAFLHPDDMPAAVAAFCRDTGQAVPGGKGEIIRCALESLALEYRLVLDTLERILQKRLAVIHIVGGGTHNELLCRFTANATGRPVAAGPVEATAIGNVLAQALAMGEVKSWSEARAIVRSSFRVKTYEPEDVGRWEEAYAKYLALPA